MTTLQKSIARAIGQSRESSPPCGGSLYASRDWKGVVFSEWPGDPEGDLIVSNFAELREACRDSEEAIIRQVTRLMVIAQLAKSRAVIVGMESRTAEPLSNYAKA